jgi:endogenous inhibitor of DNA gyrase (YacG/DUF329 family)
MTFEQWAASHKKIPDEQHEDDNLDDVGVHKG